MRNAYTLIFFVALALLLESCKTSYTAKTIAYSYTSLDSNFTQQDSTIQYIIAPYNSVLVTKMNETVGVAAHEMTKQKPESTLGNLLADACFDMSSIYFHEKPDLALLNYGGIRIPSINEGNLSLGTVYELMPFDNFLVLLTVDGTTLKAVLDVVAQNGGWPVSGVQFVIKNNEATQIKVQGEPLDLNKKYKLATSDYLAGGGDNLNMLKTFSQQNSGVFLRDAFISYFKNKLAAGEKLSSNIENRVRNDE